MTHPGNPSRRVLRRVVLVLLLAAAAALVLPAPSAPAQPPAPDAAPARAAADAASPEPASIAARPELSDAEQKAQAALAAKESPKTEAAAPSPATDRYEDVPKVNWFHLLTIGGGPLMIPIWGISFFVVALGVERMIALRRRAVLPTKLVQAIKDLAQGDRGIDPRQAYRACQKYPSAAATVIRAMLVNLDRPRTEVEQTVRETTQREADRLHGKVRWFTLAATIEPMLGLLGTVQGMIMAFYIMAHLPPGANRAVFLAESIYIALVTTFGGLVVAIPAAVLGHMFSGRILKVFRELDDLLFVLGVQIDRYQRKQRAAQDPRAAARPGNTIDQATTPSSDGNRAAQPAAKQ